ncbi:MAG: dolichyl-phosphate beta-glucosyltransferase [Acidobacteriota bacterium]
MVKDPDISIVVPAYNEARRIVQTLEMLRNYLARQSYCAEVIVVDDGSTDDTAAIVDQICQEWTALRLVRNPGNSGKGFGVRNGVLNARGKIVLFTDADLSAPIEEMPKLVDPIVEGRCDLTFGSRALDRSLIGVHQSKVREFSGRIFNLFVQLLTGLPFQDTQCGFKAFRRDQAIPIFERQTIMDFGFDPEILYIARKRGLHLAEVPIHWNHVEGTKVRFLSDSLKMFLDLLLIRWNDFTGKYR